MSGIKSTAKPDITIILNNSHNNDGTHNLSKTKKRTEMTTTATTQQCAMRRIRNEPELFLYPICVQIESK